MDATTNLIYVPRIDLIYTTGSHQLHKKILWTPGHGQKGPTNLGLSVHPSFHPSVFPAFRPSKSFLGIDSLVFPEIQHGVRGPFGVLHDRARFFEKKVLPQKWGKLS